MSNDRRGTSSPGQSYNDPMYDQIEVGLEKKYALPKGLLRRIRTKGERSNSDQVSSAGARSVYQIIPQTRADFQRAYGVDAYAGPAQAAEVAALHLRDSFKRTGSWTGAITEYIGGTDQRAHGATTEAYVNRVTGGRNGSKTYTPVSNVPAIPDLTSLDIMNTAPASLDWARRPLGPSNPMDKPSKESKRIAELTAVVGPQGIPQRTATPNTPELNAEVALEGGQRETEAKRQKLADMGWTARMGAAIDEEWVLPQLARALDSTSNESERGYTEWYTQNREDIEGFANDPHERQQLREANNRASLEAAKKDIERQRKNHDVMNATGYGTTFSLLAGLSDPVGWLAGAGMGKAFEVAGIGSRVLLAGGNKVGAAAALGAEGAASNLAITGMLDAAGRTTTTEDYAMSGGTGLVIGFGLSPVMLRSGRVPGARADILDMPRKFVEDAQKAQGERLAQATANLGHGATPEAIAREAERLDAAEKRDFLLTTLAAVPDNERLLHSNPEELLTANQDVKRRVSDRYSLDTVVSDDTERNLLAEHLARAEAIVAANPIDEKALNTILSAGGLESTGVRLLKSESPVARAVGLTLLESTTGAGGRRRTAAMMMATRERLYNREFGGFDDLYHQFRKEEGAGLYSEFVSGDARRRFNRRVFDELEARADTPEGQHFDPNPHVREAADLWERGMNKMRLEMQHVDAVGSARLGTTSRGYVTHRLDARKVITLTTHQRARVRDELAAQFVDPRNGFDAKFSKTLATKYLERAEDAAKGGYDVPMNLRNPEAADIVYDALKAMNVGDDEITKLMGKFSRGGADFTKRRLKLNLKADIGDGMVLRDLFNTDLSSMYRSYARRVAGEVALANYGIMGKKGLSELRKAISSSGGSAADLHSFDQIASEFLNTPYGSNNHKFMDNIRTATSVARLGGMGFTQMAEYGNALAALGVIRTFAAIGALPRMVKEVTHLSKGGEAANPILKSIDTLGGHLGLDDYQLTRWFDIKDNDIKVYSSENIGVGTRGLRAASHIQATLTGQRMITAVQTRGMAEQIVRKAITYIREGIEDAALHDMGVTPELAAKLRADLPNIATFDGNTLRELDLLKSTLDGHSLMQFRDAIERGASQIIQRTYIGETGKWAHDGLLKLLGQFRTFGITSVEKQWGRNMRNYGALKSSMYLLGSMSLAVPIHIARVQTKMAGMSRKDREKYAQQNLTVAALARASLNYASASGLLGDVWDIGGGFASSFGGAEVGEAVGVRGTKGQSKLIGGVVAPGVGLLEDVWDGVHGDGKKLVNLLPGANHPLAQPFINAVSADSSTQP